MRQLPGSPHLMDEGLAEALMIILVVLRELRGTGILPARALDDGVVFRTMR